MKYGGGYWHEEISVYNTMLEGEETIIGVVYGCKETIRIVWTIYMGAKVISVYNPKNPPGTLKVNLDYLQSSPKSISKVVPE